MMQMQLEVPRYRAYIHCKGYFFFFRTMNQISHCATPGSQLKLQWSDNELQVAVVAGPLVPRY